MADIAKENPTIHELGDAVDEQYRSVSGWAVASLLFGAGSVLAFLSPLLLLLPVLAFAASVIALRQFTAPGNTTTGRKAALCGMALAATFGVAAPTAQLSEAWWLEHEARSLATAWFGFVLAGDPPKALQLQSVPTSRKPLNDKLWDYYRQQPEARKDLEDFIAQPNVRALLALGSRATVRCYETEIVPLEQRDIITQYYAVTYDEAGRKKTYFVKVNMEYAFDARERQPGWRIVGATGGVRPPSLE